MKRFSVCLVQVRSLLLRHIASLLIISLICVPVHPKINSLTNKTNPMIKPIQTFHDTKEFRLSNGLKVLIKEDHSAPVFTQIIYFRVGSRNDPKGISGISHYLEHMQFNGTKTRPKGAISQGIESRGGSFNAATSTDYTMYYMTLPSTEENIDFSIELEADRLRNSIVEQAEADREKQVVLAELSGGENNPLTLIYRDVMKATYPTHPYGIPIIGWEHEVKSIKLEDLRLHYDTFYQPNNAVLILVGDIDSAKVLEKIENSFGKIPPSKLPIPEIKPESSPITQHNVQINFPTESSYVDLSYRVTSFTDKDYTTLSALSAILTNGSLSRLEKALVDTGKASYVSSSVRQGIDPFCFNILAVTDPSGDLSQIEASIKTEIKKVAEEGVTEEELERVKAKSETGFLFGIEDSEGLANQLGFFEVVSRDWKRTYNWTEELNAIKPKDIQRVAQTYLNDTNLVIGRLQGNSSHTGDLSLPAQMMPLSEHANYKSDCSSDEPIIQKLSTETASLSKTTSLYGRGVHASSHTLKNGLRIILRENHTNPVVALNGYIDAGEVFDHGFGKLGASTITALMLERGTQKFDRNQLSNQLELLGAEIEFHPETDYVNLSARGRARDLTKIMHLLAEQIEHPTFPEQELQILKTQILSELSQSKDDFKVLGKIALHQALYPENHPYREYSIATQIESVQKIKPQDLESFHREFYQPNRMTLVISGDFKMQEVLKVAEQVFGDWKVDPNSQQSLYAVPVPENISSTDTKVIEIPGKSQAAVIFGQINSVKRSDADFYPLLIANDILGGGSTLTSRLGSKVREEAGLVYSIYSQFQMGRAPGPFTVKMGVAPDKIDQAIALTKAELERFSGAEITDEELERAKNYRKGLFISQNLTSNSAIASALNQYSLVGLDLETINEYPRRIEEVSKSDVQRVINQYLKPYQMQIIILRPPIK
ncbi:MAG: pitrilysin family protein [Candidatus Caenarcaniphilales bacterium]|nr:pitrilysin family protein [Candidatus Caenarcaniphilales bacterium]